MCAEHIAAQRPNCRGSLRSPQLQLPYLPLTPRPPAGPPCTTTPPGPVQRHAAARRPRGEGQVPAAARTGRAAQEVGVRGGRGSGAGAVSDGSSGKVCFTIGDNSLAVLCSLPLGHQPMSAMYTTRWRAVSCWLPWRQILPRRARHGRGGGGGARRGAADGGAGGGGGDARGAAAVAGGAGAAGGAPGAGRHVAPEQPAAEGAAGGGWH